VHPPFHVFAIHLYCALAFAAANSILFFKLPPLQFTFSHPFLFHFPPSANMLAANIIPFVITAICVGGFVMVHDLVTSSPSPCHHITFICPRIPTPQSQRAPPHCAILQVHLLFPGCLRLHPLFYRHVCFHQPTLSRQISHV
jgi:hypothetical protein